jgi:hypothetical protein
MEKSFSEPEEINFEDRTGPILDDGWYLATFDNYEVIKKVVDEWHKDGIDKVMLWFKVEPQEDVEETTYIAKRVNRSWGARSGLKGFVSDMLGKDVNEPFPLALKPLRGTKVELLIGTSKNGMYSNIDKVRPPRAKQATIKE